MPTTTNGNGDVKRIICWIIGALFFLLTASSGAVVVSMQSRLDSLEIDGKSRIERISRMEATLSAMQSQQERMDKKLDRLLDRRVSE